MLKWLKRITIGIVAFISIAIAGAYAALQFIDIQELKQIAIEKVQEQTGRTLAIEGRITPQLGLNPTIILEDISLSNPSWAKSETMLSAKSLSLSAELLPLLQKRVVIHSVALDGAVINLESSKKGSKNWDFKAKTAEKITEEDQTSPTENKEKTSVDLTIDHITLTDSSVNYRDHKTNAPHALKVSQFTIEGFKGNVVESATISGSYNGAQLDATADLKEELLNLDASLSKESSRLNATGTVSMLDQSFDMKVNTKAKQLQEFMQMLGQTNSATAPISLTADVSGTSKVISVSNLQADYDAIPIDGQLKVNLSKSTPLLTGTLHITEIKAKKSVAKKAETDPVATQAAQEEAPQAQAALIPAVPLPTDSLGAINADIALTIDTISSEKLTLQNFKANAKLQSSVLNINPLSFNTNSGSLEGQASLSAQSTPPTLNITAATKGMKLDSLVKELADNDRVNDGQLTSDINLTGSGMTLDEALNNANGHFNFYIDNAKYTIPEAAKTAARFFDLLASGDNKDVVDVSCLVGKFNINQGVANSDVLALKTPAAIATGSGHLSLPKQSMDMTFKARTGLVGLSDLTPPVKVQGPLNNLSYIPDPGGTILGIGKLFIGATTGVGLAAVLGEQVTDRLGITADNNPCLQSISEELAKKEETQQTPKESLKAAEDNFREKRDATKENLKNVEDDVRQIRDGFLGILKKD